MKTGAVVHILVVEDERIVADRLIRLLGEILGPRLKKIQLASSLPQAGDYLEKAEVDLVFLDLNLRGKNGFELLRSAVAGAFQTVIVSAYTDRAIQAFEYGVLDFVAKPFDRARLEVSIERFTSGARLQQPPTRYLSVKRATGTVLVELENVAYIRGAGVYAELVLRDGKTLLHSKSLEKLVQVLPNSWQRVHKSYVVNMETIHQWHAFAGSKYEIELVDGSRIPVGRTRYKELRSQWL